jgi:5-hydroxyisourate hydrolase
MNLITTHVLDTTAGEPVAGIAIVLEYCEQPMKSWTLLSRGETGDDGRLRSSCTIDQLPQTGLYRLRFDTSSHSPFFPEVIVQFFVPDLDRHYHIPLLLSRFGYTTYRGS